MSVFEMMDQEWNMNEMSPQYQMANMLKIVNAINDYTKNLSRATRAANGLYFSYQDVDRMVALYEQLGGTCVQVNEGNLLSGDWVLYDAPDLPTVIIREETVNCYESGQTIETFEPDEVPEKYADMMAFA